MRAKSSYLMSAMALLLTSVTPVSGAEQDTVQAIIPWEAEGRVFQVDTKTMLFLGSMEGVMYIESSQGEMNEAFVMCPVVQEINTDSGRAEARGHCEITVSAQDVCFAEFSCEGVVGGCEGQFKLTDGEGSLAGISGEGAIRVRSPMRSLITDTAAGAVIRVGAGLAEIQDLEYRIP